MTKFIPMIAALVFLIPVCAVAQTSMSSNSTAAAAGSVAELNQYGGATPSTQTVHNNTQAPDVITSGSDECGLPSGGSTSILGFGFGFAATPTDEGCERRHDAEAWHALGNDRMAEALICENKDDQSAAAALGKPCVASPDLTPATQSAPAAFQPSSPIEKVIIIRDNTTELNLKYPQGLTPAKND